MPDNTKKNKRTAPVLCAMAAVAFMALGLAVLVFPLLGSIYYERAMAVIFLAADALVIVAVIGGVLAALRQRLREIEGGEEEDAKKY